MAADPLLRLTNPPVPLSQLAPYAEAHGLGISMKPHGTCLTNSDLLAVHAAVGHAAFGICMDPGNILCAPPLLAFETGAGCALPG